MEGNRLLAFLRNELKILDPRKYFWVEDMLTKRPIIEADLDWDPATTPTQDEMRLITQANDHWNLQGSAATSVMSSLSILGGVQLAANGAATEVTIGPATLNAGAIAVSALKGTSWLTNAESFFGLTFRPISAVASFSAMMGLKLTNGYGKSTDANQAIFHYDPADAVSATRWRIVSSNANVDVEKIATIAGQVAEAVANGTEYRLLVRIDSTRTPHFYINERLVGVGAPLLTATALIPFAGIKQISGTPGVVLSHSIVGRLRVAA